MQQRGHWWNRTRDAAAGIPFDKNHLWNVRGWNEWKQRFPRLLDEKHSELKHQDGGNKTWRHGSPSSRSLWCAQPHKWNHSQLLSLHCISFVWVHGCGEGVYCCVSGILIREPWLTWFAWVVLINNALNWRKLLNFCTWVILVHIYVHSVTSSLHRIHIDNLMH